MRRPCANPLHRGDSHSSLSSARAVVPWSCASCNESVTIVLFQTLLPPRNLTFCEMAPCPWEARDHPNLAGFIQIEFPPKEINFEVLHPSSESSRSWSKRLLGKHGLSYREFAAILVSHTSGKGGSSPSTCPRTGLGFYLSWASPLTWASFNSSSYMSTN